jgi:predicted Rossmann-fold nucleotide-binding protein
VIIFSKDYHFELMQHIDRMLASKTISEKDLELFLVTDDVHEAISLIKKSIARFGLSHEKPHPLKWLLDLTD